MAERIPPNPPQYDQAQGFSDSQAWLLAVVIAIGLVGVALLLGFWLRG